MTEIRKLETFTIAEEAMLWKSFIQKFDYSQAEELIEILLMPFSMSRKCLLDECLDHCKQSCIWASSYAKRTNNQGIGSGEVGWGAVISPINEYMGVLLKKMYLGTHRLDQEFENI